MSTVELINTGILMGIIHVLTGPDHLSALATLCGTNIKHTSQSQSRREAFLIGIRWGIGHSLGLLAVGGLLIAMEESSGEWIGMDPFVSMILESFVGVFMLVLGAYGLFKADRNNKENIILQSQLQHSHHPSGLKPLQEHMHDDNKSVGSISGIYDFDIDDDADIASVMENVLETDSRCSGYDDLSQCLSSTSYLQDYLESTAETGPADISVVNVPVKENKQQRRASFASFKQQPANLMAATSLMSKYSQRSILDSANNGGNGGGDGGGVSVSERFKLLWQKFFLTSPGILAIVAGVLHGVAGPGGVLGVIPAVQLRDARLAITYLATFCTTSTFVMGGFAAFYGTLSEWLAGGGRGQSGDRVFMVEVGSSLLSVCVGCIWLVLLTIGKLDDVFP